MAYRIEKEKAIQLRRKGKTYSEILAEVPVAKSTLSTWLKSVALANPQKQRQSHKRLLAAKRGGLARKQMRLRELASSIEQGKREINVLSDRELWLIGIALYWAEGSKQRNANISSGVIFANSDPKMIKTFLSWLCLIHVPTSDIRFELYIHENRKENVSSFRRWWGTQIGVSTGAIDRIYFKKSNLKTNRQNTTDLYHGLLRITVRSSTTLNRKIYGWTEGIVASLGSGVTGNTSAFGAEDSRIVP